MMMPVSEARAALLWRPNRRFRQGLEPPPRSYGLTRQP